MNEGEAKLLSLLNTGYSMHMLFCLCLLILHLSGWQKEIETGERYLTFWDLGFIEKMWSSLAMLDVFDLFGILNEIILIITLKKPEPYSFKIRSSYKISKLFGGFWKYKKEDFQTFSRLLYWQISQVFACKTQASSSNSIKL